MHHSFYITIETEIFSFCSNDSYESEFNAEF